MPRLASIQIGMPRTYEYTHRRDRRPVTWRTAFFKAPVDGPVEVTQSGVVGDGQADRQHHGGIDKAVLAYSADHYDCWRQEQPEIGWIFGGFGENLTVAGLTEQQVCIGDRWRLGDVVLEVSQPRQPCWKLCRRWDRPDLAKRVVQTGRAGWYLRVKREGWLEPGVEWQLEDRPLPKWTVRAAHDLLYGLVRNPRGAEELASVPQLSLVWREELLTRSS